jgi:tRNA-dihydrouridine synthase A
MMDWTDRHCRYFHRLLTKETRLYTEMVTTGALLYGDVAKHLAFNDEEHPVALQLGGNDPNSLAACAKLAAQWGYDEVNLNCGCPSPRVQRGAFGARLMEHPDVVADSVKAMQDAVDLPISVKHRIGIDRETSYGFVRDFVGTIANAGCKIFMVHARNAWLDGLSPKDNRSVPPLRHEVVHQLKQDFPNLVMVINGGIDTLEQIDAHLALVDGVMLGRQAYHNPWLMSTWDERYFCKTANHFTPLEIEERMVTYMEKMQTEAQIAWPRIARHMLGLRLGLPKARAWRQIWSNHQFKDQSARDIFLKTTALS